MLDAFCLSTFIGTPSLNGTWWYMPVAFLIILVVPMLQNVVKKYGLGVFIVSVVSILIPYLFGLKTSPSLYLAPTVF